MVEVCVVVPVCVSVVESAAMAGAAMARAAARRKFSFMVKVW